MRLGATDCLLDLSLVVPTAEPGTGSLASDMAGWPVKPRMPGGGRREVCRSGANVDGGVHA